MDDGSSGNGSSARKRPRTSTDGASGQQQQQQHQQDSLEDLKGTPELRTAVARARGLLQARLSPGHLPPPMTDDNDGQTEAEEPPPVGLEAQTAQVEALLRKALEQGLHEPFLLVGPRGSGKSYCLETALRALRRRYAAQGRARPFRAVYVDGSLESTDVAAIAEIAAQLEMSKALDTSRKAVGGGGAKGRAGRGARQQLDFIVEGMRGGTFEKTPLVFIIDHIEAFCETTTAGAHALVGQRKQLLLYSLMDLQHCSDLRFVVLGLSSELDVLDRFEKRIRSRISNKQVCFPAAPPLPTLMQIFDQAFHVPEPKEDQTPASVTNSAAAAMVMQERSPAALFDARRRHARAFNAAWARLRPGVEQLLQWSHQLGRPLRWFVTLGYRVAAMLDEEHPLLTLPMFRAALEAQACHLTATSRQRFASLANLELLVVIAMKRLADRGRERCTLDMIWAEYEAFLRQEPLLPCCYARPVLHKGLLNVLALGLASVAQRIPPGGQSYLQHQPPPDKDFATLEAADVGTASLCLEFHPGDLQDYLVEHERALPTLLVRWGSSWSE